MKKFIMSALACCSPVLVSAADITTPNMELGHWVTTADTSAILEKTLSAIPESNRAMVRKMMEDKMKDTNTSEQCITQDILDNFDAQVKDTFGKRENCTFDVTESSEIKFSATVSCPGSSMVISTKFTSAKRNESTVVSRSEGMGETKITTVSEWKSSDCPKGIE